MPFQEFLKQRFIPPQDGGRVEDMFRHDPSYDPNSDLYIVGVTTITEYQRKHSASGITRPERDDQDHGHEDQERDAGAPQGSSRQD